MPFTLPNQSAAFNTSQAEPDSGDFDALVAGISGTGVISGCTVTSNSNMTLAVASGVVRIASNRVTVSAGNVTITAADPTNARFDLVIVSAAGAKSVLPGTAAADPVYPNYDEVNTVLLAAVYVPASDTVIASNQITDKRVILTPSRDAVRFVVSSTAAQNEKDGADYLCDGTADQVEINQALSDLASTGGKVTLSTGHFYLSAGVLITKDNVQLLGTSPGSRSSPQLGVGTTLDVVSGFSGSYAVDVDNGGGTTPVHAVNLRDFMVHGHLIGSGISGVRFRSNRGIIDNVHVQNASGDGFIVEGYSGWASYDTELRTCQAGRNTGSGFRFRNNATDLHLIHCISFNNGEDGLQIERTTMGSSSPQVTGCHFYDNGQYNIHLNGTGSRAKFMNCKIEGTNAGTVGAPSATLGGKHGVYLNNTSNGWDSTYFVGCGFKDNGQSATNTYDDITINPATFSTVTRVTVSDCTFESTTGTKVRYNVNIANTSCTNWVVTNNSFESGYAATRAVNNAGSTTASPDSRCIVRNNSGWVTEISGTGTAGSTTATTAQITHGLSVTPALKDIQITPTGDPGSGIRWWVSAVTSTTFTLTTSAAASFAFAWTAIVLYR